MRPTPARGWSQKQIQPRGDNMESEQEVVVDETGLSEKEVEPFDWEDHLYETWLDEKVEKDRKKSGEAGAQGGG